MNVFIVAGIVCLIASQAYMPWKRQREMLGKTFGGLYREYRAGERPHRPAWSWALLTLGLGLSVLGYWRAWSGE